MTADATDPNAKKARDLPPMKSIKVRVAWMRLTANLIIMLDSLG
jgi:hypothetical protein